MSYVKIGVAGPVGSGKTALIEALSRKMAKDYINEARVQISSKEIKNISNPTYSYYISIEKFSYNDPL